MTIKIFLNMLLIC